LMWNSWRSFSQGQNFPSALLNFVKTNMKWVRTQVTTSKEHIEYWQQVHLVLRQFDGLLQGYNEHAPKEEQFSEISFLLYQITWEIGDIYASLNLTNSKKSAGAYPFMEDAHCSALIKPSEDGMELLSSHVTWTGFSNMLRVYKHYTTPFNSASTKAITASFSSFPGNLPSGDDWYITSANLVIIETTNGVMNTSLYTKYTTTQTVPYWIRVIVANRMAETGREWLDFFGLYNSGTYNNQWMVVDYKLFTPGKPLRPGTLYVGEQIPGYLVSEDVTHVVTSKGYWASYNIPYFPFVYDISGYPAYYKKYGNAYSYSECARAQIFRRDEHTVSNLDSLKMLMRYNEWQTDPLALKDACRGISARCDLNPPWVVNSLNGYVAFGAIDCKVTDSTLVKKLESEAVSGPTWESQPPFAWTNEWKNVPHYGQPLLFAFQFENMSPHRFEI